MQPETLPRSVSDDHKCRNFIYLFILFHMKSYTKYT